MRLLRAIGWVCLIVGLMVLVRDLLLLFDTSRWVPMNLADAWNLTRPTRPFPELGAISAIWVSPVLLVAGAVLVLLRGRPGHSRAVFRGRFS